MTPVVKDCLPRAVESMSVIRLLLEIGLYIDMLFIPAGQHIDLAEISRHAQSCQAEYLNERAANAALRAKPALSAGGSPA